MSLIPSLSFIFLACLGLNSLIIVTQKYHGFLTNDYNHGPQKIHTSSIPRVGGVSIFITLILTFFVIDIFWGQEKKNFSETILILILISTPSFFVGLLEDLLKDISIFLRFFASICVGLIAIFLFEITLPVTNIAKIDYYIDFVPIVVLFTLFFFTGLINSINLIDGVNGLSTFFAILTLFAISRITISVDDYYNYIFVLIIIANLFGFLFINWFSGLIFLGDSGAYLIGVILAFITSKVLLDNNLSMFNIFTLFVYPIWEISYSILRRFLNGANILRPDKGHLHSLIYIFVKKKICNTHIFAMNFLPTLFLMPLIILGPILTIFIYEKPKILAFSFFSIYIFYIIFYKILDRKIKNLFI